MLWRTFACGVVLMVAAASSRALAQDQHFHVTAGYAHLSLGGDDFDDDFGGWGVAARWRSQFVEEVDNLLIGAGAQLAFYEGNDDPAGFIGGQIAVNESISDVDIFSPTLDIAWRQPIGTSFFIEPGIGIGWAWGSFTSPIAVSRERTEDGLVVRPGVMVGFGDDRFSAGLDFQYSMYWIDFSGGAAFADGLDDRHDEMFIGAFLRFTF